jgi:hypothetical protein
MFNWYLQKPFFFFFNFTMVNQKNIYKFKPLLIMKKLLFTAIALVAFSSASMANTIAHEEVVSEKSQITNKIAITSIENLNVLELYTQYKLTTPAVKTGSIKCWLFGKWLRSQLNDVSNDTALINQTVNAAVALCNIVDDLGII